MDIDFQLEEFKKWLRKTLPLNRQGKLEAIIKALKQQEYTVDDIKDLTEGFAIRYNIPWQTLVVIKQQIHLFKADFKKTIAVLQREKELRGRICLLSSSTKIAD